MGEWGVLQSAARLGRFAVLTAAAASPFASHLALARGWTSTALPFAALQAVAAGVVLRGVLPRGRLRAWAVLAPLCLLAALAAGAWRSPATGLLAAAGLWHGMLYAGLFILFAASLAARRTPLVTQLARRINPAFHPGMEGYTRAVTIVWCLFFASQVVLSAVLLPLARDAWQLFVTVLSLPSAVLMALAEYAVRRWRFRNQQHATLLAMIRGVRAGAAGQRPASPGTTKV